MNVGDLVQPTASAALSFPELMASDRAVVMPPRKGQRPWQLRLRFLDGRTIRCWDQAWWKLSRDLLLTDEHRSMIASAFVGAYDPALGIAENHRRSLCCGGDRAMRACATIVGRRHAAKLQSFFYESLGCGGWENPESQERNEQYFLDEISELVLL